MLKIIDSIKSGGVGVIPTDTIYGLVASVHRTEALDRIYEIKKRDHSKKLVHLIGDVKQLKVLGVTLDTSALLSLQHIWPGPVSVEFGCDNTLPYLHKNTYCIAVRLPDDDYLRELILKTGPIVATSVNESGRPFMNNISEIKRAYPGLDFYQQGTVKAQPSKLARLRSDNVIEYLSR